jgi:hypothetical protein
MADGHLGKCKDCTKLDMRVDRHTKPRVREYDKARSNQPQRVALAVRMVREWRAAYPERVKAQTAANNALRDGRLVRVTLCQGCRLQRRVEMHHPDYARPLLVVWLCKPCHAIADKIRRALEGLDAVAR